MVRGDPAAVAALYRRYMDQLVAAAAARIPAGLRAHLMAESVVHSVMGHLLTMPTVQRQRLVVYGIRTWAQLYGLLATITLRRCLKRIRREQAAKRGADRR